MKPKCLVLAGLLAAVMVASRPVHAEDCSLWPVAASSSTSNSNKSSSSTQPGFLERVGTGTKKLFSPLMPKSTTTTTKKKPSPPKTNSVSKSEPKKEGWLGSMFKKQDPPKPQTASDWVALPKPQ